MEFRTLKRAPNSSQKGPPKHLLVGTNPMRSEPMEFRTQDTPEEGWKIAEDVYADSVHDNVPVSEGAERIIRSMSGPVIPRAQPADDAVSTAEDRVKAILGGRKLDPFRSVRLGAESRAGTRKNGGFPC